MVLYPSCILVSELEQGALGGVCKHISSNVYLMPWNQNSCCFIYVLNSEKTLQINGYRFLD